MKSNKKCNTHSYFYNQIILDINLDHYFFQCDNCKGYIEIIHFSIPNNIGWDIEYEL